MRGSASQPSRKATPARGAPRAASAGSAATGAAEETLDALPILIALLTDELRIVRVNRELERLSGWGTAEAAGRTLADLCGLAPPEAEALDARLAAAATGWQDVQARFPNGGEGPVSWAGVRLGDGQLTAVGIDIGRQRQAEQVLRAGEQRFARFMQHLPGLAWIKDGSGRYIYVNDAAARAFRRARHELYGRTDEEIFPAATAAIFRENDRIALASEAGTRTIEALRQDDGVLHHSIVSKFAIPVPRGGPPMIGGMAIDITEWKHAEEALADREARLREADRRKDEFLATLAHELRNPLAPIRNSIQILRQGENGAHTETRLLDMMERQVGHIVRLVDDLLEVSRITLGKIALHLETVELAIVIRNALETSQPFVETAGHELTVTLPAAPVLLRADPVRLAQIVANLVHNATKYTDRPGRIALAARAEGGELVITVRDTGVGIPAAMLPHVFEMFVQGDGDGAAPRPGLGIGLTLAQTLAHLHGGRIEAASGGPGMGSEFTVRLPVVTGAGPAAEQPATAAGPEAERAPARRILVADDVVDSAESLALLLGMWGHQVRIANSGREAVSAAREFLPDVVFLDIGLPDMTGYEVARLLRAETGTAHALLVALTGFGQAQDRERSKQAGFDVHLVKPVDPRELKSLVENGRTG